MKNKGFTIIELAIGTDTSLHARRRGGRVVVGDGKVSPADITDDLSPLATLKLLYDYASFVGLTSSRYGDFKADYQRGLKGL